MQQNSLENIILATQNAVKNSHPDFNKILNEIKESINNTFEYLKEANKIDIKNNNGFKVELSTLNTIIDNCINEDLTYGTVITNFKEILLW